MIGRMLQGVLLGLLTGAVVVAAILFGMKQGSLTAVAFVGAGAAGGLLTGLVAGFPLLGRGEGKLLVAKLGFSLVIGPTFGWAVARYLVPGGVLASLAPCEAPYSALGLVAGTIATGILFCLDNKPKEPQTA